MKPIQEIAGRTVRSACSDLETMAVELEGEPSLVIRAAGDASRPRVAVSTPPSSEIPRPADAVCAVDWTWIAGTTIQAVTVNETSVRLELSNQGPLVISALVWKGKPFLSFNPFRPARGR